MKLLIELVGVGLVGANILLGYRYGLLRRGIALAGVYGGVGAASLVTVGVAEFFDNTHDADALYRDALWFVAIMFIVIAGVEVLGQLYNDKLVRVASLMFDRTAGAAMGALVGCLEIAMVCLILLAVGAAKPPNEKSPLPADRTAYAQDVSSSFVGSPVSAAQGTLLNVFGPVLPKDLSGTLAQNADTTKK